MCRKNIYLAMAVIDLRQRSIDSCVTREQFPPLIPALDGEIADACERFPPQLGAPQAGGISGWGSSIDRNGASGRLQARVVALEGGPEARGRCSTDRSGSWCAI